MDYADLRKGIYDHLVANIAAVAGRVYAEWSANADSVKPFLEFAFAGELPSINTPLGMWMQLEVLVYGAEGSYMTLDPIADAVISTLHKQDVVTDDGRTIRPEYWRDARIDTWDETLKAAVIRLKFLIPTDFWTG